MINPYISFEMDLYEMKNDEYIHICTCENEDDYEEYEYYWRRACDELRIFINRLKYMNYKFKYLASENEEKGKDYRIFFEILKGLDKKFPPRLDKVNRKTILELHRCNVGNIDLEKIQNILDYESSYGDNIFTFFEDDYMMTLEGTIVQ
jgi:hypothetical protein